MKVVKCILILVIVFAVIAIACNLIKTHNEVADYTNTVNEYTTQNERPKEDDAIAMPDGSEIVETSAEPYVFDIGADYTALREVNKDVVGWVTLPDTVINYPVVQGADNDAYLTHGWNRQYSQYGAAFLDSRQDLNESSNLFIYGHSLSYGKDIMFTPLQQYTDEGYLEEHPYFYVSFADDNVIDGAQVLDGVEQPKNQYRCHIIAVCKVNARDGDEIGKYYQYHSIDDMSEYANELAADAVYSNELAGTPVKYVTLSTCLYPKASRDIRLLIVGAIYDEELVSQE